MGDVGPLVSVIVPVHNGARFLPEALASICAQGYRPMEVVIVDDGSEDDTARVAATLPGAVVLSHPARRGPAAARNTGLERASGELVAFLDADDLWPAGALATQVDRLLQAPGVDLLLGRTRRLGDPAATSFVAPYLGSGLFRRVVFDRVGRFDEALRFSEDHDWFLRARELGVSIEISDELALIYRAHEGSMTRGPDRPPDLQLLGVLRRSLVRRRASGGPARSLGRFATAGEDRDRRDGGSPLVSVIIPVHNGVRHVREAIESVLGQTYTAIEVIVVDDGSTDASAGFARRFGARVRWHAQANQGTAAARNCGVRLTRGAFLAFLDQDDLWLPDKLAFQMATVASDPALDGVFGQIEQLDERSADGHVTRVTHNGCLASALLIRRPAFQRVGWFDTRWRLAEWADWYVRAVEAGIRLGMPARLVARRRVHDSNKGVLGTRWRGEYVRVLKASLDRRRASGSQ